MAESSLSRIAESLIAKISSSYIQQASQHLGVHHHLQAFQESLLSIIKDGLLKVDLIQEQNPKHLWQRNLKHVLSDAENMVDEFECERLRNEVVNAHGSAITKVARFFSFSTPLVFRLRMAKQIKKLNKRLSDCLLQFNTVGLDMINFLDTRLVDEYRVRERFDSFPDVIIGREDDKELIIQLLMQQNPCGVDHQSLSVIPIVGMAGLGKTTLAHSVFNDKRIDQSFSSKIWVSVPRDFNIGQMIAQIMQSDGGTLEQLKKQLGNILASRKFLLVLDDVCNADPLKWAKLRNLLSMGMEGSKILVTTHSHSAASMMGTIPSYTLKGLSMKDSLSLLEKFAFEIGEEKKV